MKQWNEIRKVIVALYENGLPRDINRQERLITIDYSKVITLTLSVLVLLMSDFSLYLQRRDKRPRLKSALHLRHLFRDGQASVLSFGFQLAVLPKSSVEFVRLKMTSAFSI